MHVVPAPTTSTDIVLLQQADEVDGEQVLAIRDGLAEQPLIDALARFLANYRLLPNPPDR
jgi:hypothetical protein